jgi:hypothetical protein
LWRQLQASFTMIILFIVQATGCKAHYSKVHSSVDDENYYHISILISIFNLRLHLSFPQIKSMVGVPYLDKDCMRKDLLLRINEIYY